MTLLDCLPITITFYPKPVVFEEEHEHNKIHPAPSFVLINAVTVSKFSRIWNLVEAAFNIFFAFDNEIDFDGERIYINRCM